MGAYEALAVSYDRLTNDVDYEATVAFYEEILKLEGLKPRTAVDLACGTGSVTAILAEQGLDVIGVDLSPEMLTEADHKAMEEGVSVRFACQDMTELELGEEVDCILSLCDSMNYLTEEGQLEDTFKSIAQHMKKESLFLFDMNTEYKFKEVLGQNVFGSAEEHAAYIWENDYDEEEKINEYYVSFFIENEDGLYERIEEFHYERAYSMEEIEEGLRAAGMELVEVMDGYSFDAPHEESERLLFAARLR